MARNTRLVFRTPLVTRLAHRLRRSRVEKAKGGSGLYMPRTRSHSPARCVFSAKNQSLWCVCQRGPGGSWGGASHGHLSGEPQKYLIRISSSPGFRCEDTGLNWLQLWTQSLRILDRSFRPQETGHGKTRELLRGTLPLPTHALLRTVRNQTCAGGKRSGSSSGRTWRDRTDSSYQNHAARLTVSGCSISGQTLFYDLQETTSGVADAIVKTPAVYFDRSLWSGVV